MENNNKKIRGSFWRISTRFDENLQFSSELEGQSVVLIFALSTINKILTSTLFSDFFKPLYGLGKNRGRNLKPKVIYSNFLRIELPLVPLFRLRFEALYHPW